MKFSKERRKAYKKYWDSLKGKISHRKGKTMEKEYGEENAKKLKNKIKKTVKKRWKEGVYDDRPNLSHPKEKNPNWKGGISPRIMNSKEYKNWRKNIFKRDNWLCQKCKKRGRELEAHHIKEWALYPKLRFKISNGLTLCKKCHNKTKKGAKTCIKKN